MNTHTKLIKRRLFFTDGKEKNYAVLLEVTK